MNVLIVEYARILMVNGVTCLCRDKYFQFEDQTKIGLQQSLNGTLNGNDKIKKHFFEVD